MDEAYKKYTRPQSVKPNFIEKCSNMKVNHPKDYWLEYERKMLENINENTHYNTKQHGRNCQSGT